MSMFKQWLRNRNMQEGLADSSNPVDGFKFNRGGDEETEDHEHVQQELFKLIFSKYPDETMDFLNGIGQRGDQEVATLLSKLRKDSMPTSFREPQHPTDGDEVVPANADTGYNNSNE